jgi:hypothetical protein
MLKKSLDRMFNFIARSWRNLVGDWEPLVERPVQDRDLTAFRLLLMKDTVRDLTETIHQGSRGGGCPKLALSRHQNRR